MRPNLRIRNLALPLAFILGMPLMGSTIYTYTGNDFTVATGPLLSTSDLVTGFFTVASPLADNLNGANIAGSTLSFSFSDGPDTITNTTPGVNTCFCSPTIDIFTDGSGKIINWQISLTAGELGAENITTEDFFAGLIRGTEIMDSGNVDNTGTDTASNSGDPGVWTSTSATSAAPEPGSFVLLGLAGLAGGIRLRLRRS